ncbi:MAG: YwbE family protein [Acidobacteria bacterium]|nr:YwbE family protein [Acidobacteriota bacterium]MCI0662591.1 YwbE family protein [Acidobacteriota bacterium]
MNGQNRKDVKPGLEVEIVTKQNQRSGKRTRGIVRDILTNSAYHPHGIKVRLVSGEVGRVQEIFTDDALKQ